MFKNIVFMGTSNFAVSILKSLYQNGYPISLVYTQPAKKSNRGQKFNKSPINIISETYNYHSIMYNYVQSCCLLGDLPGCGNLIPKSPIKMTTAHGGRVS